MKFGCSTNLIACKKEKTGVEVIEMITDLGYDYLELPLTQIMAISDKQYRDFKYRLNNAGIKCEVCNNFFPAELNLTSSSINTNAVYDYYNSALDCAADLGAGLVIFGSPFARAFPPGGSRDKAILQFVELVRDVDIAAQKRGMTIAIEPVCSLETNLINTYEQACEVANIVGEMTKVMIDYYHMTWDNESADILLTHGELLEHVHFACPYKPGIGERAYPAMNDDWDYSRFIGNLRTIGYNKRISVEAYSKDVYYDARETIAFFKKYF